MKNSLGRKCHPIDVLIGKQLQFIRRSYGISQKTLAEHVGITFQQVQKYEKGLNRISCSKLCEFATFLGVNISVFFEQLPAVLRNGGKSDAIAYKQTTGSGLLLSDGAGDSSNNKNIEEGNMKSYLNIAKESTILLDYFFKLKDKKDRWKVINLAKELLLADE